MSARVWSRLTLVPWLVYTAVFAVLAALMFSRGLVASGWIATAFASYGVAMTIRAYRWQRRFVREHEALLAEIRAEAQRRIEESRRRAEEARQLAAEVLRRMNARYN